MKKILLHTGAAIFALSTAASAATFSLVGGVAGTIPDSGQTNEVLTNVFSMGGATGFFGSQIEIDTGATITASYWGYEAGYDNGFSITGDTSTVSFSTGADPFEYASNGTTPLSFGSLVVSGGQLRFSFTSAQGGDAVNGSNTDNTATPAIANFFTTISRDGQTVFLFFDDTGAGDDDNHDDFVVSLNIGTGPGGQTPTPVPLPAGGLLLLGGLGAFAVARRRKNKS